MGGTNPYAPPQATGAGPHPEATGIAFNDYDLERVSRATTWMKRVSSLQFFLGIVLILLTLFLAIAARSLLHSPTMLIALGVLVANILLLLLGAVWLRQSCIAFYDGVNANTEIPLAVGFRKLRLYLLLYGFFGLVGVAGMVLRMVR